MAKTVIQGHPGIGVRVSGPALVAHDNFSARYDLNRIEGVFSRPTHKLYGESYVGKVLVLNIAKGGVATAWMLRRGTWRRWRCCSIGPIQSSPREPPSARCHSLIASKRILPDLSKRAKTSISIPPPAELR